MTHIRWGQIGCLPVYKLKSGLSINEDKLKSPEHGEGMLPRGPQPLPLSPPRPSEDQHPPLPHQRQSLPLALQLDSSRR